MVNIYNLKLSKVNSLYILYLDMFFTKVKRKRTKFIFFKFIYLLAIVFPFLDRFFCNFIDGFKDDYVIIKNKLGVFRINLTDSNDLLHSSLYYEYYLRNWISSLKNKKIFLDIGANFGLYSIIAKNVGYDSVFAFEPNIHSFNLLSRNIKLNSYQKNINSYNFGVSDKKGSLNFYVNKYRNGMSRFDISNLSKETKKNYKKPVEVLVNNLDNIINNEKINITEISFIKIDVEGYELNVLKGFKQNINLLSEGTLIFMEILTEDSNSKEVFEILNSANFKLKNKLGDNYLFVKF